MTLVSTLRAVAANEDLNFLLTNRLPRRFATRFMGWFSKLEHPIVRDASLRIWRLFTDLDLADAKKTHFKSLHDCFTRELRQGARPIASDPDVLVSPCDAIIGASGPITGTTLLQAKGFPYELQDLVRDASLRERFCDGTFVTLRLTSSMYHRFHAPCDLTVDKVTYTSGDTWNVNPIALKRVEALFCKNERAVLQVTVASTGHTIALVPVAAILVASMRFTFLDVDVRSAGDHTYLCGTAFARGAELGHFQHGSTIIVLAPPGFTLCAGREQGERIAMGQPLLQSPKGIFPVRADRDQAAPQ